MRSFDQDRYSDYRHGADASILVEEEKWLPARNCISAIFHAANAATGAGNRSSNTQPRFFSGFGKIPRLPLDKVRSAVFEADFPVHGRLL